MTLLDRNKSHPAQPGSDLASRSVLICGSSAQEVEQLGQSLSHEGYQIALALTPLQVIEHLIRTSVHAAVLFVQTGDRCWIDSIPILNMLFPHLPIIVAAETESLQTERLIRQGRVFYYLLKPVDMMELTAVLRDAAEKGGA